MSVRFLIAALALAAVTAPGAAETRKATYSISMLGIGLGAAVMTIDDKGKSYALSFEGNYGFFGNSGRFSVSGQGAMTAGGVVPGRFTQSIENDKPQKAAVIFKAGKPETITLTPRLSATEVKQQVPLKPEHLVNVLDPAAALLSLVLRAGGDESKACSGSVAVFTGTVRADIALSPDSTTPLQILCKAKLTPISGYRETKNFRRVVDSDAMRVGFSIKADGKFRFPQVIKVPLRWGMLTITRKN
jgi:hypothetical protein